LPKALVDFLTVLLDGVTLAAPHIVVASGFTLIFGLMRTANTEVAITENMRRFKRIARSAAAS
jgi:hypothetical protein